MASPNARNKPIDIASSPRSYGGSPLARSLAAGSTPPVPQIPAWSSSQTPSGAASPSGPRSLRPEPSSSRIHGSWSRREDELSDAQKARIIRKHLMNREEQEAARKQEDEPVAGDEEDVSSTVDEPEEYPMPFHLQGGDIHHDLYKWHQKQGRPGMGHMSHTVPDLRALPPRSRRGSDATNIVSGQPVEEGDLSYREIMQPGGFRRAYLQQRRTNQQDGHRPVTKSFVHFLTLYGHFGGEELEEIDEELEALQGLEDLEEASERSPLLRGGKGGVGKHGDATVIQAVMMLLKSFVGTGVLFLGKAFFNGGILFSTCMLVFISLVSLYSFLLLVKTRLTIPGGFGEIGGILYGPWMRRAILFSIVLSQLGFVAAYTIFIAQNLQAFVMAVSDCKSFVPIYAVIFLQLLVYLPLAMIRNIQKLSWTALIADAFILVGLVYVFGNEIKVIAEEGVADVVLFNSKSFPLLIGTAVFTFEGIGLVVPITESMKEPHKFPGVLTGVMLGITVLFAGAGALGYAAYGSAIQTVVIVNLPQEDRFVNAVQFLYSMAIMLSTPLQLFPAVRIMENGIFSASGKYSNKVKWQKNVFRTCTVAFCALIAWLGASDLDKFVSLIGSVACVPLCYCYPALLHLKARATTRRQKAADVVLFLFGLAAALYTTIQTFKMLAEGRSGGTPQFGKCKPPS